jgi:hypothetical protein
LDELTDHVGIAADGRNGLDVGLLGKIQGRRFPTVDGMARKTKKPGRFFGGKSQEIFDPKDSVALLGREIGTFSLGDLLPPCRMDVCDLAKQRGVKGVFFDFGIAGLKGIIGIPELGEAPTDREAEKLVDLSESSESRAIDPAVLDESAKKPVRIGRHVHERLRDG